MTALLALLRDLAAEPPAAAVEVVITASEEVGLRGAKELDLGALGAKAAFVFDSEGPVGTVIVSAPSLSKFTAEFHGRAAHAGIEPEKGRSADRRRGARRGRHADGSHRRGDHGQRGPRRAAAARPTSCPSAAASSARPAAATATSSPRSSSA